MLKKALTPGAGAGAGGDDEDDNGMKKAEQRQCGLILGLFGLILGLFGQASGLLVNLAKTAAIPIRCVQEEIPLVRDTLGCPTAEFPCKYLGLPLSIRKQSAAQLRYLVDQLAARLPHWKAATLPPSSRAPARSGRPKCNSGSLDACNGPPTENTVSHGQNLPQLFLER